MPTITQSAGRAYILLLQGDNQRALEELSKHRLVMIEGAPMLDDSAKEESIRRIVEEELALAAEHGPRLNVPRLLVGARRTIIERLEQECFEFSTCRHCGKSQKQCTGSGLEDEIQAHRFTPGGIPG